VRDITRVRAAHKHTTDEESYAHATIGESAKSSIAGKVFILTTALDSTKSATRGVRDRAAAL
jgi:hypothetical protein